MAVQRLSYAQRRAGLLDAAVAIVMAEGVNALTLARVADEAGVTKPVAYDHFETREGLLKALYQRIDEQQLAALRAALDVGASTLQEAIPILATAYMDCLLHIGKEFGTITAALSAYPASEEFLHAGRVRYAEIYLEAVKRFVPSPGKRGKTVMLGVISAAETFAREVSAHRLTRREAIDATSRILLSAVPVK